MWQRKQTLFMLLAMALSIASLCMPIGHFEPKGMGLDAMFYNLWIRDANGNVNLSVCALFVLQLLTTPIALLAVIRFNNRMLQAKLCAANMLLLVVWYGAFVFYAYHVGYHDDVLHLHFAVCLPFVSLVLYWLARRAIIADEKLVRAADRIR